MHVAGEGDGIACDCIPWVPYDEEVGKFKFKFREGRMNPVSFLVRPGEYPDIGGKSAGMEQFTTGDTGEIEDED